MIEDLYLQAEALLNACQDLLGTRSPEIAFISPGTPVFDCCPMLAVHVPSIGEASTSPLLALDQGHRHNQGRVNLSALVVSIIRCDAESSTNNGLPNIPAKQATSLEVLQDAWVLWNGLYRMNEDGVLFQGCGERIFDGARAIDPSGGCVGYLFNFRVSIPGYNALVAS